MPFTMTVWVLSILSIFCLATLLYASYKLYNTKDLIPYALIKKISSEFDLFLYPFVKLTEPDPIPWFKKWSTGKFVLLVWSLASLLLVMFYTSNLLSYLVMVHYEPEPRTMGHIVERNERVYIYNLAVRSL